MDRPRGLRPSHVLLLKRLIALAVLAALGYAGYHFILARRQPLPERGADTVAYDYLVALQRSDCQTAYSLAGASAQAATSPKQMSDTCREVYASIDSWTLGTPKYAETHLSASVPVVLYYRAAWAAEDQQHIQGNFDFHLERGSWRLVTALPFVTAITKQRQDQHMGG
jgi:hypothetical protein